MKLKDQVDKKLLDEIMDWAGETDGFEEHHAIDGIVIAEGFCPSGIKKTNQTHFLMGLTSAMWFWVDDLSDTYLKNAKSGVDFERLIAVVESDRHTEVTPFTPESYFFRLKALLRDFAENEGAFEWWCTSAGKTLRGMQFEENNARTKYIPSYVEYIEYGSWSVAATNIAAAASLVYRLGRENRHKDIVLVDLERYFCTYQRVFNDYRSSDKERKEGCVGNLLLLLEHQFSRAAAERFVRQEIDGYARLIKGASSILGEKDLLVQLFNDAFNQIAKWYEAKPQRYLDA